MLHIAESHLCIAQGVSGHFRSLNNRVKTRSFYALELVGIISNYVYVYIKRDGSPNYCQFCISENNPDGKGII